MNLYMATLMAAISPALSTQLMEFSEVEKLCTSVERTWLSHPTVVLNSDRDMLFVRALKVKALMTSPKRSMDSGVATPPPVAAIAPISMRNQSSTVA